MNMMRLPSASSDSPRVVMIAYISLYAVSMANQGFAIMSLLSFSA
jgi:hypothetical protein